MKSIRIIPLALVLGLLGLGSATPARGFEWPWCAPSACCPRCGQPMSRHTVAAAPQAGWPLVPPNCPPAPAYQVAPTGPAQAVPGTEPATPGMPEPTPGTPSGAAPGGSTTPEGAAQPQPTAPTTAPEAAPALSSGLGGGLGMAQGALNMFGDLSPLRPPVPPEPPFRIPGPSRLQSAPVIPSVRQFKFADNQTPMPVDRLVFSFNFFDNVNQAVDRRFNVPIDRIQAYRYVLGFEKTFLDKRASFGLRMPINNAVGGSPFRGLGQSSTSVGDLQMYVKYALWMDRDAGRVLSTGLALSVPTGPTAFAGAPWIRSVHYTDLQPYLAFQWTQDRWYFIGFAAVDVPTSSRDVTMLYDDLSIGYFAYRNADTRAWIRSIAPTFEVHINTPTNHRDIFNPRDIAGTSEVVDITQGVNFFLAGKTVFSLGVAEPLTGPKPFSLEVLALLNIFF